jgi:hypothetical protein
MDDPPLLQWRMNWAASAGLESVKAKQIYLEAAGEVGFQSEKPNGYCPARESKRAWPRANSPLAASGEVEGVGAADRVSTDRRAAAAR